MKTKRVAKSALFTSILALVLCVSMLVGTTFAWFTDSVTSGNNIIAAGNLDVELVHTNAKVKEAVTVADATDLFLDLNGNEILWEPGVVSYENLTVKNVGTLALKYQLGINFSDTNKLDGHGLSEALKVGVVEGGVKGTTREAVVGEVAQWQDLTSFNLTGELTAGQTAEEDFGLVIYWQPGENDNLYNANNGKETSDKQPLNINLGIILTATQLMHEEDSFGKDYDEDAVYADVTVDNAADLETAIADGNAIIAINGTFALTKPMGASDVTFVGNGADAGIDFGAYGISGQNIVYQNLTLDNDRDGWYKGMEYSDAANNTYINCTFVNGLTTYGASTFKGCTFNELPAGNYALFIYDGGVINVEDCVFHYGNRAIKIYNEGYCPDMAVNISGTSFEASETSVANKAMIEIDDSLMKSVNVTVDDISVDSAIAGQGVYRINDGELNTSTDKSKVTVDGVLVSAEADTQEEFAAALAKGNEVELELAAGNYQMPDGSDGSLQGKTVTISGTKDTVIDASNVDARDQFITGANVVFEGVTLNFGTANYMGFANTASLTYKDCAINGLQFLFGANVSFENCELNANGAEHCVWTYGVQNVTFTDCDFTYGDRGINCYSDNDVAGGQTVNFSGCSFTTDNTASEGAVEINSCFIKDGIEVNLTGCTAPAYGQMAYISRWDSTNGANTTINIQ